MAVEFNPASVNRPGVGRREGVRREPSRNQQRPSTQFRAPARADENFIPEPESLATLIRSAVSAMRSGVYWDRGSILNLLA